MKLSNTAAIHFKKDLIFLRSRKTEDRSLQVKTRKSLFKSPHCFNTREAMNTF